MAELSESKIQHLQWKELGGPNPYVHVARHFYKAPHVCPWHDHDFYEIFWVEEGKFKQGTPAGSRTFKPGELFIVHPQLVHCLKGMAGKGCKLVNIAFPVEVQTHFVATYQEAASLLAVSPEAEAVHLLNAAQIMQLSSWIETLSSPDATRLDLDAFLIDLLRLMQAPESATEKPPLPDWLSESLDEFSKPPYLANGMDSLAELSGRSKVYLARVIRQRLNIKPTEFINQIRIAYAAEQLRLSNRSINDIAKECGLNNVTYFYNLFKSRYGKTPRDYRLKNRGLVLGQESE